MFGWKSHAKNDLVFVRYKLCPPEAGLSLALNQADFHHEWKNNDL